MFGIGSGKSFQNGLSALYFMAFVYKVRDPAAVFLQNLHRRMTEIGGSVQPVFLFDMFRGKEIAVIKYPGRTWGGKPVPAGRKNLPCHESVFRNTDAPSDR